MTELNTAEREKNGMATEQAQEKEKAGEGNTEIALKEEKEETAENKDIPEGSENKVVGKNDETALREEIERLKAENLRQKEDFEARVREMGAARSLERLLRDEGAKNPALLSRLIDISEGVDERGEFVGAAEQVKRLRESDPYLFGAAGGAKKEIRSFYPEESADFSEAEKGSFVGMTYSQMVRAMTE